MDSLKVETTILENNVGAYFNPKDMTLYEKEPHYVAKEVFVISSSTILT
jgi:hypothetical protein